MRLYHFINEWNSARFESLDLSPEEIAVTINRECKKYLKETNGKWFQRGMDLMLEPGILAGYRETRQDRHPLGMDEKEFKKFNSWLTKHGHADRSKSISCSSKASRLFGRPYYIFIKGDYKYTWLLGNDVNNSDDSTEWYQGMVGDFFFRNDDFPPMGSKKFRTQYRDERNELRNSGKFTKERDDELMKKFKENTYKWLDKNFKNFFTTNKGMKTAWSNNYEIWFQCEGYYFIREDDRKIYSTIRKVTK